MGDTANLSGNYRIEVSGWNLSDVFFVEKTELRCTEGGEKKLLLHHSLPQGAVIFVRLIAPETLYGSLPVAYQVARVQPMNSIGLCEMQLMPLHPRSKADTRNDVASPSAERSSKAYEPKKSSIYSELEEVLHEA